MKILKITTCGKCPKRKRYGNIWICGVRTSMVTEDDIPDWCPLEDAPQPDGEKDGDKPSSAQNCEAVIGGAVCDTCEHL